MELKLVCFLDSLKQMFKNNHIAWENMQFKTPIKGPWFSSINCWICAIARQLPDLAQTQLFTINFNLPPCRPSSPLPSHHQNILYRLYNV